MLAIHPLVSPQAGNIARVPVFAGGWGSVRRVFNFSTSGPTLPGPTNVYPDLTKDKAPTGGSIPLRWDAPGDTGTLRRAGSAIWTLVNIVLLFCSLHTGGVPISSYNIYARDASTPFRIVLASNRLSGSISTLYADSWYESFVLPRNSQPPEDVVGNFSIISGAKVAQTTSDLSQQLSTGAVLNIVVRVKIVAKFSLSVWYAADLSSFAGHGNIHRDREHVSRDEGYSASLQQSHWRVNHESESALGRPRVLICKLEHGKCSRSECTSKAHPHPSHWRAL